MPTIVWILIWVAVLGTVAFFVVREVRSGRKGPADIDRTQHAATREAMRNQDRGPNGVNQTFGG